MHVNTLAVALARVSEQAQAETLAEATKAPR